MSSDVDDDQVLPESLQKLEIVPVFSHSQSACKANEHNNPFFSELSEANRIDDRVRVKLQHKKNKKHAHTQVKEMLINYFDLLIDNQRLVWTNMYQL